MAGWSLPIGKIFGVEVRLHTFFVFILIPAALWAGATGHTPPRGVILWAIVLLAVIVREIARAVVAAAFDLDLRSLLLLPTGAIAGYAGDSSDRLQKIPRVQRAMALTGPVANLLFAFVIAGLALTVAPGVQLAAMPWVSPAHLLRSLVWINLLLAALNLLPAWPLDAGRVAHGTLVSHAAARPGQSGALPGRLRGLVRVGWSISVALIVYGVLTVNWWVLMAGLAVMMASKIEQQDLIPDTDADGTRVGDVMLTEYSVLPASATLEDALMQSRHSLQDIFPVVRGGNMVGAVGRQNIIEALNTTGNGYVQGIMTRTFRTAATTDLLVEALKQAVIESAGTSLQIVPVVEGDAVIGILTPQHLHRALALIPRKPARSTRATAEDEGE